MCPCQYGRLGAFTSACCIYWVWAVGGPPVMLAGLYSGNLGAIGWAIAAVFGVGWLLIGVFDALSHDDDFVPQSVLWSISAVALATYGIWHDWYVIGDPLLFHLSRAAWFGWIASEALNIWLNMRGFPRIPKRSHSDSEWQTFVDQQSIAIATLTAERDRLAHDLAQAGPPARDLEEVLRFPNVRRAVLKALHRDSHAGRISEAEARACDQRFKKATAIFERIGNAR